MLLNTRFSFGSLIIDSYVKGAFIALSHQKAPNHSFTFSQPVIEINGQPRSNFVYTFVVGQRTHRRGWEDFELGFVSKGEPNIILRVTFRRYFSSPFLRVRYRFTASAPCKMTKVSGMDQLTYFGLECYNDGEGSLTEIDLSQYEPLLHTYQPGIEFYNLADTFAGQDFPGPIVIYEKGPASLLLAYEHGADAPDAFLHYVMEDAGDHARLTLQARKGNYFAGQEIGPDASYESIWFEMGVMEGDLSALLPRYREFLLKEMSMNTASHLPHIGYNTWNYQERNKLYHQRPYLESMNLERMLAEIEVAHRMGIEIFVIDTGWFDRPGDWVVHPGRFPDGLREVKRKLDEYGMQLGLWFDPRAVGLASQVYQQHPEWEMSWQGQAHPHWVVWESEMSTALCLASDYAEVFAQVMLRFREELGVTYFKWDGIGQFGCDSPLHHHGGPENSPEERADCYAFQMGRHMIQMVEKVTERYPEVIVDFDATENRRFMGLGFLSVGHYFLINNGSYPSDFDLPDSLGLPPFLNVFFFPGAARSRVCRRASLYDSVAPSNLFLVHYLPDGPQRSLENSLASLVLGGNGIWGDLPALSEEEVTFWAGNLADYKRVMLAVSFAYPRVRGFIGSSPEVHEKIQPESAAGVVAFFTTTHGTFGYVTQPIDLEKLGEVKGADQWEATEDGCLKLTVTLDDHGARTVFLLPKEADKG
jgi:alpha-galactosidase